MTPVRPPMIIPPPGVVTLPIVAPSLAAAVTAVKTETVASPSSKSVPSSPFVLDLMSTASDIKPPTSVPATVAITSTAQTAENAASEAQKQKLEELEKKLAEEQEPQTLQQQENMMIKGTNARHILMQKLMRRTEVIVNFVFVFSIHFVYISLTE